MWFDKSFFMVDLEINFGLDVFSFSLVYLIDYIILKVIKILRVVVFWDCFDYVFDYVC